MRIYGVSNDTIKWFKTYLDYRIISTRVGDAISDEIRTENQLSEGSQLSSTLFIIQIADINQYLQFSIPTSFADDHSNSTSDNDLDTALKKATIDANNTVEYFKMNRFCIQSDKTSLMIIRPNLQRSDKNDKSIIVDGNIIKECKYVKLLGMYIDNQLSFQEHCKIISKKSRSTISALRRLAPYVNIETSSKVIKSCLISRITYGGLFYLCKKPLRDNMQKIVMKACRIAKRLKISDRVRNEDILNSLKIPSLEIITKRQMLLQMSKWGQK